VKKLLYSAFVAAFLITGCGDSDSSQNQSANSRGGWAAGGFGGTRTSSVETQTVSVNPIAEQVRSYGNIKAQNVVAIAPQVSNRITRIYVDLGDTVSQGQVMAKIYDATFRDQLSQARSQVEQSQIALQRDSSQFERQSQLLEKDLISDSEYDIALATYRNSLAQYQSAVASLTQAQENFNNTEVRSPVKGVVTARNLEEGDLASTGTALFEVASTTGYESRIYLPVQDWRAVKIGQEVNLRVSNEEGVSARGVVSRKSPQLDATTGLGEVVITLNQIGPSIYPGVLVENMITIESKPRAVTVPRSALVEQVETVVNPESNTIDLEKKFSVFVSNGDSVAERRELTLGIEQGDRIEVVAGLRPGEDIIVTGQQGLEDGSRIAVASGQMFQAPGREITNTTEEGSTAAAAPARRPGGNQFGNLTAEQREKLQNMSQEERREFFQKLRQQRADSTSSN
jgi:RND family efflux transporter MFP subunit